VVYRTRRRKIGRITPDGILTEYTIAGGPVGIVVGRDRQLYVALFHAGAVTRVNLHGQVTGAWPLPDTIGPLQVTTGFGLDIWVTDPPGNQIYRVMPYADARGLRTAPAASGLRKPPTASRTSREL
jgi:hypothetical protein